MVFHWHGEMFDVPYEGGLHLLDSEANTHQAFSYGQHVLGLQFHLEVTNQTLNEMLEHVGHELTQAPFVQDEMSIRAGVDQIRQCNHIMGEILRNWLYS